MGIYFFSFLYIVLIFFFLFGYLRIDEFIPTTEKIRKAGNKGENPQNRVRVSVIVAAHNEEATIGQLLKDLACQSYPKESYEVICINDNSSDNTSQILSRFCAEHSNFRYYDNPQKGKKSAVAEAVNLSKGDLILATDADCRVGEKWISVVSEFYEKSGAVMIISSVLYADSPENGIFEKMQMLEFLSLQASTAGATGLGSPIMCNGANLAYEKKVFLEFDDPTRSLISSGDDVFLMLNIKKKYPKKIAYLKNRDAVVRTFACRNIRDFFVQRRRWAAKSVYMNDFFVWLVGLIVAGVNILLLASLILSCFRTEYISQFLTLFASKSVADFIFLLAFSRFFSQQKLMFLFLPLQAVYFIYVDIVLIISSLKKIRLK